MSLLKDKTGAAIHEPTVMMWANNSSTGQFYTA
jgi:hypothetical protein